jgi:hypothetical protein
LKSAIWKTKIYSKTLRLLFIAITITRALTRVAGTVGAVVAVDARTVGLAVVETAVAVVADKAGTVVLLVGAAVDRAETVRINVVKRPVVVKTAIKETHGISVNRARPANHIAVALANRDHIRSAGRVSPVLINLAVNMAMALNQATDPSTAGRKSRTDLKWPSSSKKAWARKCLDSLKSYLARS